MTFSVLMAATVTVTVWVKRRCVAALMPSNSGAAAARRRPGAPVEGVEVDGGPVVRLRGAHLEHVAPVARPGQRPIALTPVKALLGPEPDARGERLILDPRLVGVEPRSGDHRPGTGQGAHERRGAGPPSRQALAPDQRGEQREQDGALGVLELGWDQGERDGGQGDEWQRGDGAAQVAQRAARGVGRRSGATLGQGVSGEGEHERGVEQEQRSPQQQHHAHGRVGAVIGHEQCRQAIEPLPDRPRAHRDPHVAQPGPVQSAHQEHGQRREHGQRDSGRPAACRHPRAGDDQGGGHGDQAE
jgi:hypothetical protein